MTQNRVFVHTHGFVFKSLSLFLGLMFWAVISFGQSNYGNFQANQYSGAANSSVILGSLPSTTPTARFYINTTTQNAAEINVTGSYLNGLRVTTSMNISQNIHLKAEQLITTEDVTITLENTESGIFQAGGAITFSPNTTINIENDASFEAKIESCSSVTSKETLLPDDQESKLIVNIVDKSNYGCIKDLVLKPNPFKNQLLLEITSDCNFQEGVLLIQSNTNQIMTEKIISYENDIIINIDASNYQTGVYYIIFITDNGRIVRKALKI